MIDETATFYVPGNEPLSADAAREQLFGLAISAGTSKPEALS